MPTEKRWQVGRKALLSPVTVFEGPFTTKLLNGQSITHDNVPDNSTVEIVDRNGAIVRVKIVAEGSGLSEAKANVFAYQLHPIESTVSSHKDGKLV